MNEKIVFLVGMFVIAVGCINQTQEPQIPSANNRSGAAVDNNQTMLNDF
jgi:hypothetical protein